MAAYAQPLVSLIERDLPIQRAWIEPAVLPKGGKLLFGGLAKTGKSMVMLNMALALATGATLFGYTLFRCPTPVRVLIIEQELGEIGLQERSRLLFHDVERAHMDNLWYISKDPELQLDSPQGRKRLWEAVAQVRPAVVFLDPFGKMHTQDDNSNQSVTILWRHIDRLIKDFADLELSVVASHHFGKPLREPGSNFDLLSPYNFRGASQFYNDMDSLVTMHRTDSLRLGHEAWKLRTRWGPNRHGGMPEEDLILTVNRNQDLRVVYEASVRKGH